MMKNRFFNRERELGQLLSWVQAEPEQLLISISGEGGVGKTSLVTEAIRRMSLAESSELEVAYIDFDHPSNRTLSAIRQGLASTYGKRLFGAYIAAANDRDEIERSQLSPIAQERASQRERDEFYRALGEATSVRRLLLVLDTLEKILEFPVFEDILLLIKRLRNCVIVVVGRNNVQIDTELKEIFGANCFRELPIWPLNVNETKQYLDQNLLDVVDEATREKIWLLTEGKPILLDLTCLWVSQTNLLKDQAIQPGSQILGEPLNKLHANIEAYREGFKHEIVQGIRDLETPIDWAILYMALMEHPCSIELWQDTLGISEEHSRELMAGLEQIFFIRADHTLHDIMKDLVTTQVWPYIDPGGQMRSEFIQRLLSYTIKHKAEMQGWERWHLEAEELHYRLMVDTMAGHAHFLVEFDLARDQGRLSVCQLLVQTMQVNQHWHKLSPEQRLDVRVRRAQLYTYVGEVERMRSECDDILQDPDVSEDSKVNAYCAIAYGQRESDVQASADNYERALNIAQKSDDEVRYAQVSNWAGQTYRRLGEMGKAVERFSICISLADNHKAWLLKASAQNNLAYVYRQTGEIDKAFNLARMAWAMRKKLKDDLGLAYSHQTIGEIYRDINDIQTAEQQFRIAREMFSQIEAAESALGHVLVALANLCRKRGDSSGAVQLLEDSLEIFRKTRNDEGRAQALNEYGCEYRRRGREHTRALRNELADQDFRRAESHFLESIEISRKMNNRYRLADSLSDLCLLYRYWFQNCTDNDGLVRKQLRIQTLEKAHEAMLISRRHKFTLIENRAIEALGDLAYAEGKYTKAFVLYYSPACLSMAKYFGSPLWRYHLIFNRVNRRLINSDIPDDEIRFIAAYMVRRWCEEGKDQIAPDFVSVYNDIAEGWRMAVTP